eukprot:scaffold17793_cov131-Isochrysis_galbana.AAC.4
MVSTTLHLFFLTSNEQMKISKYELRLPISARRRLRFRTCRPWQASLHVRFKIHDGYDSEDEDQRKPSEKLTAEKLEMLDSAVIDPNGELTLEQKDQMRQLLASTIVPCIPPKRRTSPGAPERDSRQRRAESRQQTTTMLL